MTQTSTLAYTSSSTGNVDHREDQPFDMWDDTTWDVNPLDYLQWDYCQVCSRSTDHTGDHDDLLEQGKVAYDNDIDGNVVRVFGRGAYGELLTREQTQSMTRVGFSHFV